MSAGRIRQDPIGFGIGFNDLGVDDGIVVDVILDDGVGNDERLVDDGVGNDERLVDDGVGNDERLVDDGVGNDERLAADSARSFSK